MSLNPIKQVYKFNQEAGLLEAGYSDERECAFPIEEALEGFTYLADLAEAIGSHSDKPKNISRYLVGIAQNGTDDIVQAEDIPDVDRFDKHLDTIVFALGSLFKLGLNPQQVMKGLGVVANANMAKLTVGKDEAGKQMKPKDFKSPEPLLQKILDERQDNG